MRDVPLTEQGPPHLTKTPTEAIHEIATENTGHRTKTIEKVMGFMTSTNIEQRMRATQAKYMLYLRQATHTRERVDERDHRFERTTFPWLEVQQVCVIFRDQRAPDVPRSKR